MLPLPRDLGAKHNFWIKGYMPNSIFLELIKAFKESLVVVLICTVAALLINKYIHPNGIPLIAKQAYETLVPCPEPGGMVAALDTYDINLNDEKTFWVDARSRPAYEQWHVLRAVNIVYDYLDPTPDEAISKLTVAIARSRAHRVVVYGDGQNPDTGELLGREISGKGIKNVYFIAGGAPKLRKK